MLWIKRILSGSAISFTAIGAFIMDSTTNLNSNGITMPIPMCSRRIGKD